MIEVYKNHIAAIESTINELNLDGNPKNLYDPIRYIMSIGGKRMRPLLVLLSYGLYEEDFQPALVPAVCVEMFHNFTLMHDDIMDEAPIRRGQQTVHMKWDRNNALLSGDVMLVKTYDLFLENPDTNTFEILRWFNKTAREVCEGQQLDMNFEKRSTVSIDEYLEMIRLKTAVLLGFSLELGASLADASPEDTQALYDFGELIGVGFQLKDDLLDAYATADFGKQVGGDIIANKKTYLTIRALDKAQGTAKKELEGWFSKSDFEPDQKVQAVMSLYEELSIREDVNSLINEKFDQAYTILSKLSGNLDQIEQLRSYCENLRNRMK